jgi:hypothetical protein
MIEHVPPEELGNLPRLSSLSTLHGDGKIATEHLHRTDEERPVDERQRDFLTTSSV